LNTTGLLVANTKRSSRFSSTTVSAFQRNRSCKKSFSNPLFLRLICEALRDDGTQAIPAGRDGIRSIINLLMRVKNERAATQCDFDRRETA
jgi:hypothetical protein